MIARNWAEASDEEVFAKEVILWTDEDREAFRKERERRIQEKREAQERIERERFEKLKAIKENLEYSDKLAEENLQELASGELLTIICREENMPTMRRCNPWLKEYR